MTDTICYLEEGEPGDIDDDLRKQIMADFNFMAAARTALPTLLVEVQRLRADVPDIVG